jgi:hypothetical protein
MCAPPNKSLKERLFIPAQRAQKLARNARFGRVRKKRTHKTLG